MKFLRTLTLLCLTLAMPAAAEDVPDDASLIRLSIQRHTMQRVYSTRVFDLRTDVRNLRRDEHFIPLTEIKWLLDVVNSDPFLNHTVVHIRFHADPIKMSWPPAGYFKSYVIEENIPPMWMLEGFITRSSHPSNRELLLQPIDSSDDFYVSCLGSDIEKSPFCSVYASYPPDPNIKLRASIYYTKPPFNFREIAHRMREIAYCLDVTDQLAAEGKSQEREVDADLPLPVMKGCEPELSS